MLVSYWMNTQLEQTKKLHRAIGSNWSLTPLDTYKGLFGSSRKATAIKELEHMQRLASMSCASAFSTGDVARLVDTKRLRSCGCRQIQTGVSHGEHFGGSHEKHLSNCCFFGS